MTKLHEDQYDAGGGRVFERRYAIEHLEWQNCAGRRTDMELAAMIRDMVQSRSLEPEEATLLSALAEFLGGTGKPLSKADLVGLIWIGNLWGLGAQNGVSLDADLVWAGVARALRRAGVEHVNDLPDAGRAE